jgi:TPR repeat protein
MDMRAQNFEVIEHAAKQRNDVAQCQLGWLYSHGVHVERNDGIAVFWYKAAAE